MFASFTLLVSFIQSAKKGQTHAISEADRLRYLARYKQLKAENPSLTYDMIGLRVGLTKGEVSKILAGKSKQSTRKPQLDRYFGLNDQIVADIIEVVLQLDDKRRQRLYERALALLEEQDGKSN
jgi:hypothetical protein